MSHPAYDGRTAQELKAVCFMWVFCDASYWQARKAERQALRSIRHIKGPVSEERLAWIASIDRS